MRHSERRDGYTTLSIYYPVIFDNCPECAPDHARYWAELKQARPLKPNVQTSTPTAQLSVSAALPQTLPTEDARARRAALHDRKNRQRVSMYPEEWNRARLEANRTRD